MDLSYIFFRMHVQNKTKVQLTITSQKIKIIIKWDTCVLELGYQHQHKVTQTIQKNGIARIWIEFRHTTHTNNILEQFWKKTHTHIPSKIQNRKKFVANIVHDKCNECTTIHVNNAYIIINYPHCRKFCHLFLILSLVLAENSLKVVTIGLFAMSYFFTAVTSIDKLIKWLDRICIFGS